MHESVWPFCFYVKEMTMMLTIYLIGVLTAFWMLRVDYMSGGMRYTVGIMILNIALSLLSWIMVVVILAVTWIGHIGASGYWNKEMK